MNIEHIGKILILTAFAIGLIGFILYIAGKGFGLQRIPGDIFVERENWKYYFPIATSVIISIVLTIAANVILWLIRR